jgi:hypothetical protein
MTQTGIHSPLGSIIHSGSFSEPMLMVPTPGCCQVLGVAAPCPVPIPLNQRHNSGVDRYSAMAHLGSLLCEVPNY